MPERTKMEKHGVLAGSTIYCVSQMRSEWFAFCILGSGGCNRLRSTVGGLKLACLWGKPPKRVFLDVSEDVLMSFCVAGVALCDIRRV